MYRSRQQGWIGLLERTGQARIDDSPRGVFARTSRAVDISRGYRPAEDTDNGRKSLGLDPLHEVMSNRVLLGGSN
jgi:hypothetical protein